MPTKKKKPTKRILFTEYCSGTPFDLASTILAINRGIWFEVMEQLDAQERTLEAQIRWHEKNNHGGGRQERMDVYTEKLRHLRDLKERLSMQVEEI